MFAEMRKRSSNTDFVILSRLFNVVERSNIFNLTSKNGFIAHVLVEENLESSLFGSTEDCASLGLILRVENGVDNTSSAESLNGESNENSDSGEVSLNEIRGTIKRVNPNDGILSVEGLEFSILEFVRSVSLSELLEEVLTRLLLGVKEFLSNEILESQSVLGVNNGIQVLGSFLGFLTLNSESRVDCSQVDFNSPLDLDISNGHGTVITFLGFDLETS